MSDPLVMKGVDQNPAGRVIDRIHHIQSVIEGFDLRDGHVFEAGSHARALRVNAKIFIEVLGDLAVRFRAYDQAVFGAHLAAHGNDFMMHGIGLASGLQPDDLDIKRDESCFLKHCGDFTGGAAVPVIPRRDPETHTVVAGVGGDTHHVGRRYLRWVAVVHARRQCQ